MMSSTKELIRVTGICLCITFSVTTATDTVMGVAVRGGDAVLAEGSPLANFPMDRTSYQSTDRARYGDAPIQLKGFSVVSTGSSSIPLPHSGGTIQVDSFFDVFTELSVDGGQAFGADSFFDVFFDITVTDVDGQSDDNTGTFQTEIVSMSLSGGKLPEGVMIRESESMASLGELSIQPTGEGQFSVDSFFDVFTELSVDGGQTWQASDEPLHLPMSFSSGRPSLPGGGVLIRGSETPVFPLPGSRYQRTDPVPVASVDIELVALNLVSVRPVTLGMLPGPGRSGDIDGFFDVFTELSADGGQTTAKNGFFDVFFDITVTNAEKSDGTDRGKFLTEIVSMSLSGGTFPGGVIIRESRGRKSLGELRIEPSDRTGSSVDSFFDVFTELSVDGGQTWVSTGEPMRLDLSLPDGASDGGVVLPRASRYESSKGAQYVAAEIELVALNLVNTAPVQESVMPVPGETVSVDSFFDVFTELSVRGRRLGFVDSFFDVFTELSVDGEQSGFVDAFFDVLAESSRGPGKRSLVDSFFDVFTEFSVTNTSTDPDNAMQTYEVELLGFDLLPEVGDEVLVMLRESPTQASQGQLVRSILGSSDQGRFSVDSFFDVFTELSVDGGESWLQTPKPAHLLLSMDRVPEESVAVPELIFPFVGVPYESLNNADLPGLDAEIVSLTLVSLDPTNGVPLPEPGGRVMVNAFFDVFVVLDVNSPGNMLYRSATEVVVAITHLSTESPGTFLTEIVSMELSGDMPGRGPWILRESPSEHSRGRMSVSHSSEPGELPFSVDSFFDVFTELSVDGGDTFSALKTPIRLGLTQRGK